MRDLLSAITTHRSIIQCQLYRLGKHPVLASREFVRQENGLADHSGFDEPTLIIQMLFGGVKNARLSILIECGLMPATGEFCTGKVLILESSAVLPHLRMARISRMKGCSWTPFGLNSHNGAAVPYSFIETIPLTSL